MNIMAVCDDRMLFRDIYVGWPGSVSDARVWKNSPLYKRACADMMRPMEERIYFRNDSFIIGDGGYFLKPFCIIPYKRYPTMPFATKLFNFAHSSTRMVIENAFGMLKSRFRLLGKQVNFKTTEVDLHASCSHDNSQHLHNTE